uniref:Protein N-terminal asparagine amidohydrolase n=1 Tax=Ciona savignyi TaxID=51511 RepID=H2ZB55_CIOSA
MMTTCHMAVLRCQETSTTSLAHFDGTYVHEGAAEMVKSIINIRESTRAENNEVNIDLHLLGGFDDDRELSVKLSTDLLQAFHSIQVDGHTISLHLRTFCCTSLNTRHTTKRGAEISLPIIYGAAVELKTGQIYPVAFDEQARAPMCDMRGAKSLNSQNNKMCNIYKWRSERVVIPAFTFAPFPAAHEWLEQSDAFIRKHMSTSPTAEPLNFASHIRESLCFIVAHPEPMESVFKSNHELQYALQDGKWMLTWVKSCCFGL